MDFGKMALAVALSARKPKKTFPISRGKWYQGYVDAAWSNGEMTHRTKHEALCDCHTLALEFGNFYLDGRTTNAVPLEIQVVVETTESNRPVYYDVTFNGKQTVTMAPGERAKSDEIGMELYKGQTFYVRTYMKSSGYVYNVSSLVVNGEGVRAGNLLKSDSFTGIKQAVFGPLAIHAIPSGVDFKVVACIGDSISIGAGLGEEAVDNHIPGEVGFMQVGAMRAGMGFITLGMNGQSLDGFTQQKRLVRMDLAVKCDIAIVNYGTNDLTGARTLDALKDLYLDTWKSLKMRGLRVFQTTITPRTTSTDNWATVENQAPANARHGFGPDADRAVLNRWIRSIPSPHLDGVIDVAAITEAGVDSGRWVPDATTDGIHPNRRMHLLMADAVKEKVGS